MRLSRRFWIRSSFFSIALTGLPCWLPAQEGHSTNGANTQNPRNVVSLEDQLNNGLRTVTITQRRFNKYVTLLVKRGSIPEAMVQLVYDWALEKNAKVPFPYFEFAMRELTRRRGVRLP